MYKHLLVILCALIMLQACTATAIVGAGAGGYYIGKDKREFSVIMADASITALINSKLIAAKGVTTFDINVDTYEGIVTLNGKVASRNIRSIIISLSKNTNGVKEVISELEISR